MSSKKRPVKKSPSRHAKASKQWNRSRSKEQKQRTLATGKTLKERAVASAPGDPRKNTWDKRADPALLKEIQELLTAWDAGSEALRQGFPSLHTLCAWIAKTCPIGVETQAVIRFAKKYLGRS